MMNALSTRVMLVTAVLALLAGPVVLLFFFDRPSGLAVSAFLFLYGSGALWFGLRRLEGLKSGPPQP